MFGRWCARLAVAAIAGLIVSNRAYAGVACDRPVPAAIRIFETIEENAKNPSELYRIYQTVFAPQLQMQMNAHQFISQTIQIHSQFGLAESVPLRQRILNVSSSDPDGASTFETLARANAPGQITQVQISTVSSYGRIQQFLALRCHDTGWKVVGIWYKPS